MRFIALIISFGLLIVLGSQTYSFLLREREVRQEFAELHERLEKSELDQERLQAQLDFYSQPTNLEKEVRARFNLKEPGEKVLIIVPRNETTTEE